MMIAYEFYLRDAIKGYKLVGKLQEKRKYPNRITYDSIMNWGRKLVGDNADFKNLFVIQIKKDEHTGKTYLTHPSFSTKSS